MKKLFIALFVVSLSMFSSSSFAIWEGVNELPTLEETYKGRDLAKEEFDEFEKTIGKYGHTPVSNYHPTVFTITIDGKSRECWYKGKDIICR
ncbi:hypothetical protein [Succinivibrio sp.]|uniref:hypothetical protein n=1 Tax=Succinivibrio sp. TaxID=2053619 RepID=UPI00386E3D9C